MTETVTGARSASVTGGTSVSDRSAVVARVGRVGSWLAEIPSLWAELPQYLAGSTPATDEAKIKRLTGGSRPPLDLEVLDLIEGYDLKSWCDVQVSIDGVSGMCAYLAANAARITEDYPKFPAAIEALYWRYRRAARQLPPAQLNCLVCGNGAFIENEWFICREVEEHARTLTDIEHEIRYAQPVTAAELEARFPSQVNSDLLRQWKKRGKLVTAKGEHVGRGHGKNLYWPWDVFRLLNPVVAEALDKRDSVA